MNLFGTRNAYRDQRAHYVDVARSHLRGAKDARRHLEHGLAVQHLLLAAKFRRRAAAMNKQIATLTTIIEG